MTDYISPVQKAYEDGYRDGYLDAKKDYEKPSADVVERKHGKWIYPSDVIGFGRCSNCKALWDIGLLQNRFFRHCPRCGAQIPELLKEEEK